jgi:hypothetical protein
VPEKFTYHFDDIERLPDKHLRDAPSSPRQQILRRRVQSRHGRRQAQKKKVGWCCALRCRPRRGAGDRLGRWTEEKSRTTRTPSKADATQGQRRVNACGFGSGAYRLASDPLGAGIVNASRGRSKYAYVSWKSWYGVAYEEEQFEPTARSAYSRGAVRIHQARQCTRIPFLLIHPRAT